MSLEMATFKTHLLLVLTMFITSFHLSLQNSIFSKNSVSLTLRQVHKASAFKAKVDQKNHMSLSSFSSSLFNYRLPSKYSMALIASLRIGTPPQTVQMVLDTGSQLPWISCNRAIRNRIHRTSPFYTSLSSTFSDIPCNHSVCPIHDNTLGPTCDGHRRCGYSYFYADGTSAEGNFVKEKFTFSSSQITLPLILGCTSKADSSGAQGILGMNLGPLSFISQLKVQTFSYCVPNRGNKSYSPTGTLYLGPNPNSRAFKYIGLSSYATSQRMPNFDPLAYSVPWVAINIGGKRLNIPGVDPNGSGQTMIDSGTQYTYLVDVVYSKLKEQVLRLAGSKLKKGYIYQDLELCFNGNSGEIGNMIGDMVFEFGNNQGVIEVVIAKERILDDVGRGMSCFAIGSSGSLGGAGSNIIGNFHQQNHWVEFDVKHKRVGFGNTSDCNKYV